MEARKFGSTHVLKIEKNEPVLATLTTYALSQKLTGLYKVDAIGALKDVQIGYMQKDGTYRKRLFEEDLEVVSFTGNLAQFANAPRFHVHASFGRGDFSLMAGHFFDGIVAATLEVFVQEVTTEPVYRFQKPHEMFPCLDLQR